MTTDYKEKIGELVGIEVIVKNWNSFTSCDVNPENS